MHVHLHCILPGGGISPEGDRWIASRENFFIHFEVLSRTFRGKFLDGLKKLVKRGELRFTSGIDPQDQPQAYRAWLDRLYASEWVVHCKPPFGGSEHGLGYLARYTHRVAISNDRLLRLEDDRVHFRYKDYKDDGEWKETSLHVFEFIRRLLLHVLPDGFQRIRYYGLLAHRCRGANLKRCRQLLGVAPKAPEGEPDEGQDEETWQERLLRTTGIDPTLCASCGQGRLVVLETVEPEPYEPGSSPRGPP